VPGLAEGIGETRKIVASTHDFDLLGRRIEPA